MLLEIPHLCTTQFSKWRNKEMKNAMHFETVEWANEREGGEQRNVHTHTCISWRLTDWLTNWWNHWCCIVDDFQQEIHTKTAAKIKSQMHKETSKILTNFFFFYLYSVHCAQRTHERFTMKSKRELNHIKSGEIVEMRQISFIRSNAFFKLLFETFEFI